jgi:GT2 family glycosyltransferase
MPFRASREAKVQVQPRSVIVFLDVLSDQEVAGWAYDEGSPLQPVTLSLHIDDAFIQDFPCDRVRQDVLDGGFPTGSVGFSVVIPSRYCNDQPHLLELRSPQGARVALLDASGRGRAVWEFRFSSTSVFGLVEGLHDGAITGWAFRHDRITDRRHGGLQVLVTCDGHPVGQVVANLFRPDVAEAGACDPNCGFRFVAPANSVVGKPVELRFNVIPGGVELQNSPYVAEFPEPEEHRKLRQLQASADHILAQLAALRAQIDDLLPRERFSLHTYDRWARAHQRSLSAARLPPLPTSRKGQEPPLVTIICAARQYGCAATGSSTGHARTCDVVAAVQSVVAQTYAKWELVLIGDGSPELAESIADLAGRDPRIRSVNSDPNDGMAAGVNAALKSAKGRYVAFVGQDELIAPPALALMVEAALRTGARLLYCDEDSIDDTGTYSDVRLKPDWNYRLLLAQDYVGSMLFVERGHIRKVGPLRLDLDGAWHHDLVLRLAEITRPNEIHHMPEILCHRRHPAPAASSKSAIAGGVRAVSDHLKRKGLRADVRSPRGDGCYEINWTLEHEPKVSIIIPYREHIGMTLVCVDALRRSTDYRNYEIVLMDNWSVSVEAMAFAAEMNGQDGTRVVRVEESFNFARLNNLGAAATQGEFLLFMNNDVVVTQPRWLAQMVGEALADPLVAIVGNKLLYPNRLVQHGGLVLGVAGIAEHAHRGLPADHPGYMARAVCAQDLSAVTAACMLCRRDAFVRVAGFDEVELPVSLNDVDLCLKVAAAGYRIVWTPSSVAEHRESLSRGSDFQPDHQLRFFQETNVMQARWGETLKHDRCYHRYFSSKGGIFTDLGNPEVSFATTAA